ncbi:MAG: hypothetical protein ACREJB_18435 [Planctomycetaceae bacterium]
MKAEVTATLIDDMLKLDHPIELPNHSRVRVIVEPVSETNVSWKSAMEAFKRLCEEHPIHSGGLRYTREELHERR